MKTKRLEMVFGNLYRAENENTVIFVDFSFPIPEIRMSGDFDFAFFAEVAEEVIKIRSELMKHYLN